MKDTFDILRNYKQYDKTQSCFLDGRYINIVLKGVNGFISTPINISIALDKNGDVLAKSIQSNFFPLRDGINIIRVRIKTTHMSHSALLWIDMSSKEALYTDVVSDTKLPDHINVTHNVIDELIKTYLNQLGIFDVSVSREKVPNINQASSCERYGYCNAFVIKQVYDYVNNTSFDPLNILRFAAAIEHNFSSLLDDNTPVEEEYFIGLGLGLGLLGGVALGSALARPRTVYQPYPVYQPYQGYPAYPGYY